MSVINWKFVSSSPTGYTYDFAEFSNPESQQNVLSQRLGDVEVPRRHGVSIQTTAFLAARQIILRGSIAHELDTLRGHIDNFFRQLLAEGRGKLHEWDNRYVWATAQSVVLSYREGAGMTVADFSVDFLCDDPYWYSTTLVSTAGTIVAGTPLNLSMNNIDNTGHITTTLTLPTPPKITVQIFSGGMTACTAALGTRTFSWAKSPGLVDGQLLIVDMATKDVLLGTAAGGPDIGTSDRTGLASTADFFELASGNNTIVFTASHNVYATVYHRPRWA